VQARTQQLTASKGQSGLLLDRAHGPESSSSPTAEASYVAMEARFRIVAAVLMCLIAPIRGAAQVADFKITWVKAGEAVTSSEGAAAAMQPGTKIARVDVQPTIVEVAVGKQVCIDSLQLRAFGADGRPVTGVPLVMEVRQDHKPKLQITHLQGLCVRPARSGEYPIRFTSKIPAADDTLRGAQIFLRAK
jgi:hypothetical protein